MKSPIVKRSIIVDGHKTSVSLEDAFWQGLKEIARARRLTLSDLVGDIDHGRSQNNLSSTLRLFVLGHYRNHAPVTQPDGVGTGAPTVGGMYGRDSFL